MSLLNPFIFFVLLLNTLNCVTLLCKLNVCCFCSASVLLAASCDHVESYYDHVLIEALTKGQALQTSWQSHLLPGCRTDLQVRVVLLVEVVKVAEIVLANVAAEVMVAIVVAEIVLATVAAEVMVAIVVDIMVSVVRWP